MSPSKLHHPPNNMNGDRPSPLKLNKESHLIHKSSSSSSSISCSSSSIGEKSQKTQPVIIYMHSPKVIHTQAKDFMALVQKLTGLSRSDDQEKHPSMQEQRQDQVVSNKRLKSEKGNNNNNVGSKPVVSQDDNQSSSISSEENCCHGTGVDFVISPILNPPNHPYFADVPLFTPTATDFFFSSSRPPVFRYPDLVFTSPKIGNPVSPTLLEFMKGLPEYQHGI